MMLRMMRLKGEVDDDVENDDAEEGEDDDVVDDDVEEEEDRSQDQDPHFVRACAVEMHLEVLEKPFCARIKGKTLGPQIATHTLGRFSRNALGRFTKAILCENL